MNKFKIEIPIDRRCCWNCTFAVFVPDSGHLSRCSVRGGRQLAARTYKCNSFYNKTWPLAKKGE